MPTGLTAEIYEGKNMSFRRFALKCFTQIGGGYEASNYGERDLPLDKPPVIKVDKYYFNRWEEAKNKLDMLERLKKDSNELEKVYNEEMEKRRNDNESLEKQRKAIAERYKTMLEKAEHWDAPEAYKELKKLMIKQLQDSIEFDCRSTEPAWTTFPTKEEWIDQQIEFTKENVKYYDSSISKQINLVDKQNEYIRGLYKALDKYAPYQE